MNKLLYLIKAIHRRIISYEKLARKEGVQFGKNCHFMTRAWGSEPYLIHMGDNVETSSGVTFVTHDGSMRVIRNLYSEYKNADFFGSIKIGNNVFIGINATILPGTQIGDNVIIGAGSIVKGKIKADSVYAGVPAKYICSIQEYVDKNKDRYDYTKSFTAEEKKKYLLDKYNINI